jgi:hypothetical protein
MLYQVKVPDELMERFQRYLREGMGVPQAIRRILDEEKNGSDGISKSAEEVREG